MSEHNRPDMAEWEAQINDLLDGELSEAQAGDLKAAAEQDTALAGAIIEKVSGQGYEAFVREQVLKPAGAGGMRVGETRIGGRLDDEVRYYTPHLGPSVFADDLGERVPWPYGGWYLEAMDSHGAWVATAEELVRFACAIDSDTLLGEDATEAMYARPPGAAGHTADGEPKDRYYSLGWSNRTWEDGGVTRSHGGSLSGTATVLVKRPDGRNWALLFNARGGPGVSHFASGLREALETELDAVPVR